MSFRKTVSWVLFPITMWYAIGVWLRNLLFDLGVKRQEAPAVTTIGVGNLCTGGAGKTPHVEYLLKLLSKQYSTALLSRGYRRRSSGFVLDDGSHSPSRLGDEPAMVAAKFPEVKVGVCEKRVAGVQKLMALENPPQVVLLDDVFQHRYIKPTINILLTEYGNPYFKDRILPYGNLREGRRGRYRANIVVVTKSPQTLNPIEKHNIVDSLGLKPFQKVFFSYTHYLDPLPLMGDTPLPLQTLDAVLLVTGIADPEPMMQHVSTFCKVTHMRFADHHRFSSYDIKRIRRAFVQIDAARKLILTTEKDAARMRVLDGKSALEGLPVYYLPIEVKIHQNNDMSFDQTVQTIVHDNVLFQERMNSVKFDY